MSDTSDQPWTKAVVRDLVEKHFCGPSPDCEERQVFAEDEWGVLKTTAITWSGWDEHAHKVLPRSYWNQPDIEVHAGDVLVTKAGPRQRVGVVCHVPSTRQQLVVSGKMICIRPNVDLVDPVVLAGLIAGRAPQKFIHDRTTGMAESQVNFANDVLLDAPLLVPPADEQVAIAKVLNSLATAISESGTIVEKLKRVRQGLLHNLLTRGVDSNGELRPPDSVAPDLYQESPLGLIPKDWGHGPLCSILAEPTRSGLYKQSSFRGRGPLMVQMGGLFRGDAVDYSTASRVQVTGSELAQFGLALGDLLFARRSLTFEGAGLCVVVRDLPELATFESSIVRARLDFSKALPEFVNSYLRGERSGDLPADFRTN